MKQAAIQQELIFPRGQKKLRSRNRAAATEKLQCKLLSHSPSKQASIEGLTIVE